MELSFNVQNREFELSLGHIENYAATFSLSTVQGKKGKITASGQLSTRTFDNKDQKKFSQLLANDLMKMRRTRALSILFYLLTFISIVVLIMLLTSATSFVLLAMTAITVAGVSSCIGILMVSKLAHRWLGQNRFLTLLLMVSTTTFLFATGITAYLIDWASMQILGIIAYAGDVFNDAGQWANAIFAIVDIAREFNPISIALNIADFAFGWIFDGSGLTEGQDPNPIAIDLYSSLTIPVAFLGVWIAERDLQKSIVSNVSDRLFYLLFQKTKASMETNAK